MVISIGQCLDQLSVELLSKNCLLERSHIDRMDRPFLNHWLKAVWDDCGLGLKMEIDSECTSSWRLSTDCTLTRAEIIFLIIEGK